MKTRNSRTPTAVYREIVELAKAHGLVVVDGDDITVIAHPKKIDTAELRKITKLYRDGEKE